MPPSVAIIMRARNEMPHVQRTLEMLRRQSFSAFILYAVDSGSTDGTLEALQASVRDTCLKQIAPEHYVPGRVLNNAIARTDEEIIVLLNADAVPESDRFLEDLLAPVLKDEADAVFARQAARPDARFIVAYDYLRGYQTERKDPYFFSAAACAFRRSLWDRVRFRETGYAEDSAWAKACMDEGARFRFIPEAVVEHSHNYSLKELYRKRYRQAVTLGKEPRLGKQAWACLREIVRDNLYAMRKLQLHTIPYNLTYRTVIHAAMYRGLRDGR